MSDLTPIEFKNQRIMTTKILAEQYGTKEDNISKNFNRNIDRFVEGKHYYRLEGEELKVFKGSGLNDDSLKFVSVLYLWTEKGAARHAKILDTDEAWEVYEALEETYFRVKDITQNISQLSPELQAFKQIFDSMAKQEIEQKKLRSEIAIAKQETAAVKEDIQNIREVVEIKPSENWRNEVNALMKKICYKLNDYKAPKEESYQALKERASCDLKVRLKNMRARLLLEGSTKSKIDSLNYLDVIKEDKKLIEIYTAIVKEMAIKFGVA
ncbi:MAG: ORF6N domain-containing protein [Clostridium lundense]|nr:ORF6N domain-containing protein [Clostridium lundense]